VILIYLDMKKLLKGFSLLIAMLGVAFVANAQEDAAK
jgi:hypothetical protein